jgi:hypothetical protein
MLRYFLAPLASKPQVQTPVVVALRMRKAQLAITTRDESTSSDPDSLVSHADRSNLNDQQERMPSSDLSPQQSST